MLSLQRASQRLRRFHKMSDILSDSLHSNAALGHISRENNMPPMFDVDCNLTHAMLAENAFDCLERAKRVGVESWLVPGSKLEDSFASLDLQKSAKERGYRVLSTIGVHPYNAGGENLDKGIAEMRSTLEKQRQSDLSSSEARFYAIGECGLDYSQGFPDRDTQIKWFLPQLDLACEFEMPLFLHERAAHADMLEALAARQRANKLPNVLVHCFTGSASELMTYLEMGCWISFAGLICREKAGAELRDAIKQARVPMNKIMVETDAPYLGFTGCRDMEILEDAGVADTQSQDLTKSQKAKKKKRDKSISPNVPSALPKIVRSLAEILEVDPGELAKNTTANAEFFFGMR